VDKTEWREPIKRCKVSCTFNNPKKQTKGGKGNPYPGGRGHLKGCKERRVGLNQGEKFGKSLAKKEKTGCRRNQDRDKKPVQAGQKFSNNSNEAQHW